MVLGNALEGFGERVADRIASRRQVEEVRYRRDERDPVLP